MHWRISSFFVCGGGGGGRYHQYVEDIQCVKGLSSVYLGCSTQSMISPNALNSLQCTDDISHSDHYTPQCPHVICACVCVCGGGGGGIISTLRTFSVLRACGQFIWGVLYKA